MEMGRRARTQLRLFIGLLSLAILIVCVGMWRPHRITKFLVRNNHQTELNNRKGKRTANIQVQKEKKPNIIFILVDDMGWRDVGYHDSEIKTPVIDKLAREGVRLENYYVQAVCSPSRASIMTGRYMSRTGIERFITATEAACLRTDLKILPELLGDIGYTTHLVGKWHLGMSRHECLPLNRGFHTFFGFHGGGQGYYDHWHGTPFFTLPRKQFGAGIGGFDFWENETATHKYDGIYSTHLYTREAEKIIGHHAKNEKPMFLFLSFQAVHSQLQVPDVYTDQYNGKIENSNRKLYAGMMSCVDQGIGNITKALKRYGMWNSTVIIFSSDNGGNPKFGADNYPLAGKKHTYFEGGIRVAGFVNSPLLSAAVKGKEYRGLMGGADWMKTIVAGIANEPVLIDSDSVNIWPAISETLAPVRHEYLHAVGGNCHWDPLKSAHQRPIYGTIRVNEWKLRIGSPEQHSFYEVDDTYSNDLVLFNIETDPLEQHNMYTKRPAAVNSLIKRLKYHCQRKEEYVLLVESEYSNPKKFFNGTFTPWLKDGDDVEYQNSRLNIQQFLKYYTFI